MSRVALKVPSLPERCCAAALNLVCFLALIVAATGAWGAPSTCSVSAPTLAFGAYDTLNATTGSTTITVFCTDPDKTRDTINYTLALSAGAGSFANRQLSGTGDILNYNLYTSATYTTVWGDGTGGSSTVTGTVIIPRNIFSSSATNTVYGRIPGPQNVEPGSYSTAIPITITVTY